MTSDAAVPPIPQVPASTPDSLPPPPSSLLKVYLTFFRIGALAFGGGLSGWVYHEAVEVRRWVDGAEFASGLALSQILPGTNVGNMTVYLGLRVRGLAGAVVALLGLLSLPFFASIALYTAFDTISQWPWINPALDGITAGAVGLILRMAYRTGTIGSRSIAAIVILGLTFIAVGILEWPLLPVVAVLAPVSIALQWWQLRKAADAP